MAIVYDRLNTSRLSLSGNGASTVVGTIYAGSAALRWNGNGCAKTMAALIVVGTVEFNGNPACLRSSYTRSVNMYVPPDGLHLSEWLSAKRRAGRSGPPILSA